MKKDKSINIKKVTVGVVSATIASSLLAPMTDIAYANEVEKNLSVLPKTIGNTNEKNINIRYLHLDENTLNEVEKSLIKDKEELYSKLGTEDKTYILVYKSLEGRAKSPNTKDETPLSMLLSMLAASTVILLVTKKKKKIFITVLVVSALAGVLSSQMLHATELELESQFVKEFSIEKNQNLLPPTEQVGNMHLMGYIEDSSVEQGTRLYRLIEKYKKTNNKIDDINKEILDTDTTKLENKKDDNEKSNESDNLEIKRVVVPFDVEVIEDENTYEGEEEVSEGVNGLKEVTLKNGKVIKEVFISEPIKQYVRKGKKPIITKEEIISTELVNFTTEYIADDTLTYGERIVTRSGVVGESKVITQYMLLKGIRQDNPDIKKEKIRDVVNEQIKVGIKPTVIQEELLFDTIYEEDDSLAENTEKVVFAGENGVKTTKTIYSLNKDNGEVSVSDTQVTRVEPKNKVVKRGTGKNQIIPFNTIYEADETLEVGEKNIVVQGENGENDHLGNNIKPMVNRIVKVGTKPEAISEDINYEVIYESDSELPIGEQKIIQKGQKGIKITNITYTLNSDTGEVTRDEPRISVTNPQNEIIKVGSGENKEIPFDTLYQGDETLDLGNTTIVTQGENGLEDVRGKILKQPVDRVIVVGTKPSVNVELIPFSTRYENDETVPIGRDEIYIAGKDGKKTTTTRYTVNTSTGDVISGEPVIEIIEATTQVIKRGTGENRVIPFTIIYQSDDNLEYGNREVITRGRNGLEDVRGTVLEPAIDEIIKVGTKSKVLVEDIEFETEVIETTELAPNVEEIVNEGRNGRKTTTTTYTLNTATGEVVENSPIIQIEQPSKKIVRIGKNLERPNISITRARKNDNNLSIFVENQINDSDNLVTELKTQIFDGNKLVKEVVFDKSNTNVTMDNLEYDIEYTVKSVMNYKYGSQNLSETITHPEKLTLELKKIEIKQIDNIELWSFENNEGRIHRSLTEKPSDISNYFAKIKSDKYRDILLPVIDIEEITVDGQESYKITLGTNELVQDKDLGQASNYKSNFEFNILKSPNEDESLVTSMESLIDKISKNPMGDYILATDIYADDYKIPENALSYIEKTFSGTLTGLYNGVQHAIYNLKAPLFNQVTAGSISSIDLKNVNIAYNKNNVVGALANKVSATDISDISVNGIISGTRDIGGVIGFLEGDSKLDNVLFKGSILAKSTPSPNNIISVGGISSRVIKSTVKNAKADVNINVNGHTTGGIAGIVLNTPATGESANIENVYATGEILNESHTGKIAGIVGSTKEFRQPDGRIKNAVTAVRVTNGNLVYGSDNAPQAIFTNITYVDGVASGRNQNYITGQNSQDANRKVEEMMITASFDDSSMATKNNSLKTDYTKLTKADANRNIAYNNIEKLIPFYNKEIIVKYGNKVSSDSNLHNKELLSVTPMMDNMIVSDIYGNKENINKLMLLYKDNTVEYIDIKYLTDFDNNHISEYAIGDTGLIYTPEQFISSYDTVISEIIEDLKSVELKSERIANILGTTVDKINELYLDQEFEKVKSDIQSHLRKVLATDKSINTTGNIVDRYIIDYISDNKEKLLLGLSYMNRWYNIDFGSVNIKELSTYNQDFFGKPIQTLEWLVSIADSGFNNLKISNNLNTYKNSIAKNTENLDTLFDYLEKHRELFTRLDNNSWFKESTKAYIVEIASLVRPDWDVSIYNRMKNFQPLSNGILPMLTAQEGLFVISSMSSISYGMYDRYFNMAIKEADPAKYQNEVQNLKEKIEKASVWQRDHYDTWYKIVPENVKERMFTNIPVWDGFMVKNKWLPAFGPEANQAILDFFGPIGRYFQFKPGASAYANGYATFFITDRVLDQAGSAILTHEMVHNLDGNVYLGGFGRREGMGAENYALGLLEVPSYQGHKSPYMTLNMMFDFGEAAFNDKNNYHNKDTSRFQSANDIREYTHGMFDVLYTMDYAEATAVLRENDNIKKKWFNKIENYYVTDARGKEAHAGNSFRPLTDDEVALLKTWEDLVDNSIMTKREYGNEARLNRNGYYRSSLFSPIYSALHNPKGAPGDLMFRRMAYELLAAKGYEEGFLPYTSNKFAKEAWDAGDKIFSSWSNRDVALITDDLVFDKILRNEYSSWNDFKKAMFRERIGKLNSLKSTTIQYLGNDVTIDSFEKLQQLMDEAVRYDINNGYISNNGRSRVRELKGLIYSSYLKLTKEFRESIFH